MNDHYTVISRTGEVQTSRVVIADSSADAAETHREHYPGSTIIRVVGKQRAEDRPHPPRLTQGRPLRALP